MRFDQIFKVPRGVPSFEIYLTVRKAENWPAGLPPRLVSRATRRPPGHFLKRFYLEPRGIAEEDFARQIGVDTVYLDTLLAGETPLKPLSAVRIAVVLGTTYTFWLHLQNLWDPPLDLPGSGRKNLREYDLGIRHRYRPPCRPPAPEVVLEFSRRLSGEYSFHNALSEENGI